MITLEKLLTELNSGSLNEIIAGCHCAGPKTKKTKKSKKTKKEKKSKKSKKGCPTCP